MGDRARLTLPEFPDDGPSDAARAALATAELVSLAGADAVHLLSVARRQLTDRIQELCVSETTAILDGSEHHRQTISRHGGIPKSHASSSRHGISFGAVSSPRCPEAPPAHNLPLPFQSASFASLPPATAGHRADLGAAVAAVPRPEARKSLWARVVAANAWLEDSWLGHAVAALFLAVTGYILFFAAGIMS